MRPLLYRIHVSGERAPVAVIVAQSKEQAEAFAQGRYGSGSSAEEVAYEIPLSAGMVCEVLNTKITRGCSPSVKIRVVEVNN